MAEKEWLLYPLGLPGTAGRGPARPMAWEAWEAGGKIPPRTRIGALFTGIYSAVIPIVLSHTSTS